MPFWNLYIQNKNPTNKYWSLLSTMSHYTYAALCACIVCVILSFFNPFWVNQRIQVFHVLDKTELFYHRFGWVDLKNSKIMGRNYLPCLQFFNSITLFCFQNFEINLVHYTVIETPKCYICILGRQPLTCNAHHSVKAMCMSNKHTITTARIPVQF